MGNIYKQHMPYAEIIGRYTCHDGQAVWLKLDGCGASDNHDFTHRHHSPEFVDEMYSGKLIRLVGRRSWDGRSNMWGYSWTVHPVNLWEQGIEDAPEYIKAMCGTNC